MQVKTENQIVISPPRPAWNWKVKLITLSPFIFLGIGFIRDGLTAEFPTRMVVIVSLSVLYAIVIALSYLVQSPTRVIISQGERLRIYIKDKVIGEYDLGDIKSVVGKNIKRNSELPLYELEIEKQDERHAILLNSGYIYSKRQWDAFSESLARAIGKSFRRECWVEKYDGQPLLISVPGRMKRKKNSRVALLLSLAISLLGALCFKLVPSAKTFVLAGLATMAVNLCIFLVFVVTKNKEEKNNAITIAGLLFSMIVPYAVVYLVFVFFLTGFGISDITKLFH